MATKKSTPRKTGAQAANPKPVMPMVRSYLLLGGTHDGERFVAPSDSLLNVVKIAKGGPGMLHTEPEEDLEEYVRHVLVSVGTGEHVVYCLRGVDPIGQLLAGYKRK